MDSERIPRGLVASLAKSRIDLPQGRSIENRESSILVVVVPQLNDSDDGLYTGRDNLFAQS